MKTLVPLIGGVAAVLGSVALPVQGQPQDQQLPSCVQVSTQARFVMGYDHLVHVQNGCEKTARCQVWTDVNPDKQKITVLPGKKETVLTFRGSPAREFKAQVACTLQK